MRLAPKITLVPDAKDWSRWWSVRLSLFGSSILALLEAWPHAVSTIFNTLPTAVTSRLDDEILRWVGLISIVASPIARVIEQKKLKR